MRNRQELEKLAQLTELNFKARSAEMHKLKADQQKLSYQFREIEAQGRNILGPIDGSIHHRLTGLDVLFQVWVGRQLSAINAKLAQLRVEEEVLLQEMKAAYGKNDVLSKLLRRERVVRHPGEQDL